MALEALTVINRFGTYAPVISKVFQFMKEVLNIAEHAGKNDKRCNKLKSRLNAVYETLEIRTRHISNDYPFGQKNTENLMRTLENIRTFLRKFEKRNIRKYFTADLIAPEIKELNEALDSALLGIIAYMEADKPKINNNEQVYPLLLSSVNNQPSKCGQSLAVGETYYHCRTCTTISNSVLCRRCYEGTNHNGHDVLAIVNITPGSWCDCGDSNYWKVHLNCKHHSSTKSSQCGTKLNIGEPFYHCRTCTNRSNSILCRRCYEGTNHHGHDVLTGVSNDASNWCDCGDPDYWRVHLNCKYHSSNASHTKSSQCGTKLAIGETFYHCRTCTTRSTSVLCGRCYVGTNHIGHDIFATINSDASAWCDCGDPEYWKVFLNCKYHPATGF